MRRKAVGGTRLRRLSDAGGPTEVRQYGGKVRRREGKDARAGRSLISEAL